MFKLKQFAAPKKPGMLGRAVAVSMLPPASTSLPPSWFSASPPVGLNFFHPVLGRQSWQILKAVFLVFPPVPGMSWTADSGRLWSLRLARAWYDGVQPRWWPIWWSNGFNAVLIRGMILQTPTAPMRHTSQLQEPVWIWLRSVSDMFEECLFSKLRSLGI